MLDDGITPQADPALVRAWLTARSVARGLLLPVPDRGGYRVDTALPGEVRRHVFAGVCDGLRDLAATVTLPGIFLKACIPEAAMRALLPARWALQPASFMMTCDTMAADQPPLPAGYSLFTIRTGSTTAVRIMTDDGDLAASGFAAEAADVFVYDRIVTAADHQRRGLGRAVMAALGAARRSPAARQLLVATGEGRALYETLGWTLHAPYASAVIPFPAGADGG